MIKFENVEIVGWEAAIRGMRNPKNSQKMSDSFPCYDLCECGECLNPMGCDLHTEYCIGPNDLRLMTTLRNAGTDHRKFMRMIVVYVDVTAPLFWWKEADQYKVGTTTDSCSTMHKIHAKEFTIDDFSHEHLLSSPNKEEDSKGLLNQTINLLNYYREKFNETDNKDYWWQMIQLLPSSYNQRRTYMLNYEVLANIYKSRRGHKLDEWRDFCDWIETLPYSELITGKGKGE